MPELLASPNHERVPFTKRQRLYALLRSDYLKLIPILALAAYIAFIPHMDYPYPVHVDEWSNLANCKALMGVGDVTATEPFSAPPVASGTPDVEVGFRLFLGLFQQISGLSWITVFRYLAPAIFILTVLSAYILGKRKGFGWEAALMTCFITTTLGILGPGFLVASSLGLTFILLSIYLAFYFRSLWSYVMLFILMCFLIFMHPPSAVGLAVIIGPYILLNLKGGFKRSLGLSLALGIPFLPVPLILGIDNLASKLDVQLATGTIADYVQWPELIQDYGYIPTILCLIGVLFLIRRGGKESYGLVIGFVLLLLMLVVYIRFHYGVEVLYSRGLIYTMLIMGIFGGCGLWGVRQFKLPDKLIIRMRPAFLARNVGGVLCLLLVGIMLVTTIPAHQDTYYYHMIDADDYQAFVWISEQVDDRYDDAILDPWKATAFTAITGRSIHGRIKVGPSQSSREVEEFLRANCWNTAYMRALGASIVYTRDRCDNPDLVKAGTYVYLLKD
jgi:hypothetical protein